MNERQGALRDYNTSLLLARSRISVQVRAIVNNFTWRWEEVDSSQDSVSWRALWILTRRACLIGRFTGAWTVKSTIYKAARRIAVSEFTWTQDRVDFPSVSESWKEAGILVCLQFSLWSHNTNSCEWIYVKARRTRFCHMQADIEEVLRIPSRRLSYPGGSRELGFCL